MISNWTSKCETQSDRLLGIPNATFHFQSMGNFIDKIPTRQWAFRALCTRFQFGFWKLIAFGVQVNQESVYNAHYAESIYVIWEPIKLLTLEERNGCSNSSSEKSSNEKTKNCENWKSFPLCFSQQIFFERFSTLLKSSLLQIYIIQFGRKILLQVSPTNCSSSRATPVTSLRWASSTGVFNALSILLRTTKTLSLH